MKTGLYYSGKVVHYAKFVKKDAYSNADLYEALCSKMQRYRTVCYLSIIDLPVTCKRCLKKHTEQDT